MIGVNSRFWIPKGSNLRWSLGYVQSMTLYPGLIACETRWRQVVVMHLTLTWDFESEVVARSDGMCLTTN